MFFKLTLDVWGEISFGDVFSSFGETSFPSEVFLTSLILSRSGIPFSFLTLNPFCFRSANLELVVEGCILSPNSFLSLLAENSGYGPNVLEMDLALSVGVWSLLAQCFESNVELVDLSVERRRLRHRTNPLKLAN